MSRPSADPTDRDAYRDHLLLALRLHDVPGPRIAEALAEVDSHLSETGETPVEAFGPPRDYARELAPALGGSASRWAALRHGWQWDHAAVGVLSLSGCWLLTDGVHALTTGSLATVGLPGGAAVALGLVLLALLALVLRRGLRVEADPVLDPRTGADLAPPAPRWVIAVMVAVPSGLLALTALRGLLAR